MIDDHKVQYQQLQEMQFFFFFVFITHKRFYFK